MFRFAIRKGWATGDTYQKEQGLAAQQCWSQQVLPRARSRVNIAFAAEFMFYGALVTVSPQVSPHCTPLNRDSRTEIAHSWSFLVKREQHQIQHSKLSTLLHNRACTLYPANLYHLLLTVRFWTLGLPLCVVSHSPHQTLQSSSPSRFSLTEAQLFRGAPDPCNSHKWLWHNCHDLA